MLILSFVNIFCLRRGVCIIVLRSSYFFSSFSPKTTGFSQQRAQPRRSVDDDDDLRDREDEAPQVVAGIGVSESEAIDFARRNLVKKQSQTKKSGAENEDEPTAEEIEAEQSGWFLLLKVPCHFV